MPNKTTLTIAEKKAIMMGVMDELQHSDDIMAQFPDQDFGHEKIPLAFRVMVDPPTRLRVVAMLV